MKPRLLPVMLLVPLSIAYNPAGHAADASDASPYDLVPACMDRTASNCVVQDQGYPRHTYAPPGQPGARAGTILPGTANTGTTANSSGTAAGMAASSGTGTTASSATTAGTTSTTATTAGPRDGGRGRSAAATR